MTSRWLNLLMRSLDHSQQHVATCLLNINRELISHQTFQIYTGRFYQMLSADVQSSKTYSWSSIFEKSGNGQLRLSYFADDYALRANTINSEIGRLSVKLIAKSI